jgi:hypothetical protein
MNIEQLCLKVIALICLNAIAFIFDGQYIPVALGIDALTLGFSLKDGAVVAKGKDA